MPTPVGRARTSTLRVARYPPLFGGGDILLPENYCGLVRHHLWLRVMRVEEVEAMNDWIERNLAEAPPLSSDQIATLVVLLRGGNPTTVPAPPKTEAEKEVEAQRAADEEFALRVSRTALSCAVCQVPRFVHPAYSHPWVPPHSADLAIALQP